MNTVYMNNAAEGWPKAPGVVEAVAAALAGLPDVPGRGEGAATQVVASCRGRLAGLFGAADPSRVVLTSGATHALNLAMRGLRLARGARVVTSVLEHNSVLRPLEHLRAEGGIDVEWIGLDSAGELDRAAYEEALARRADLVVLTHASNVTGQVLDVSALFGAAKAVGARTLLDAAQTSGLASLAASELNADMVVLAGHKALHGPGGVGALYVAPGVELAPFVVGGTGVRSELRLQPDEMPMRLEAGTPNVPAIAGLDAALAWCEREGQARWERVGRARARLAATLRAVDGVRVHEPAASGERTGVVSFSVRAWSAADAGLALAESFGIVCRAGLHCAPLAHPWVGSGGEGSVRLSVSSFTTDEDIRAACAAVAALAGCAAQRAAA